MKTSLLAVFFLMLFAVSAFAASHTVPPPKPHYPKAVVPQNPYLKHLSHKPHRFHHK
jgi:hypothetical protein